jgi:GLPGLI family protein
MLNHKYNYEIVVDLRKIKTLYMKKLLFILTSFSLINSAIAQSADKALARVKYTSTHIIDTTMRDKPNVENMLLVVGKNASVYTSYEKIMRAMNMQKQLAEQLKNQEGSGNKTISIKSESKGPVTDIDYFYFNNEQKLITKERLFNNYIVEEDAPQINWKITKDTASFSGIACQKATTTFKGREWTAWFAPSIPFQSGPWKLNGLPGLIVEAYDAKKEVKFEFAGLENVEADEPKTKQSDIVIEGKVMNLSGLDKSGSYLGTEISLPTDAIKTSRKELDKLKAARDKDPQGFMQAQMAANGIQGNFRVNSSAAPVDPNKPKLNNPIELPEKK